VGDGCGGSDPMCARRSHTEMVHSKVMKSVRMALASVQNANECKPADPDLSCIIQEHSDELLRHLRRCSGCCQSENGCTWFSAGMVDVYDFIWNNITQDIIYMGGNGHTMLSGTPSFADIVSPTAINRYPQRAMLLGPER
jgi:hypothetical protein